jgi:hypothetical protein
MFLRFHAFDFLSHKGLWLQRVFLAVQGGRPFALDKLLTVPSSTQLGLIAGNGSFPLLLLDAAVTQGAQAVVAAIQEETSPQIEQRLLGKLIKLSTALRSTALNCPSRITWVRALSFESHEPAKPSGMKADAKGVLKKGCVNNSNPPGRADFHL